MNRGRKHSKKGKDRHFKVFEEYNKKLMSFPVVNDPFMSRKRAQYRKLATEQVGPNVFDRLTTQPKISSVSDDSNSTAGIPKLSTRSVER